MSTGVVSLANILMKPAQSVLVVFIVCIVFLTYYIGQGEQILSLSVITDPIILMGQFLSLVHINATTSIAVLLQNHKTSLILSKTLMPVF